VESVRGCPMGNEDGSAALWRLVDDLTRDLSAARSFGGRAAPRWPTTCWMAGQPTRTELADLVAVVVRVMTWTSTSPAFVTGVGPHVTSASKTVFLNED
jgi:hypothetical protein